MAFRRGEHEPYGEKINKNKTKMKKIRDNAYSPPPSRCINIMYSSIRRCVMLHSCRRSVAYIDTLYNDEMHCARLRSSNTLKLPFNEIFYNPKFYVPRETSSNRSFAIYLYSYDSTYRLMLLYK